MVWVELNWCACVINMSTKHFVCLESIYYSIIYVVSIISFPFSCLPHQSSVVRNVQVETLSHGSSCQPDLLDGSYGRPSERQWRWCPARLARLPTTQTKEKHDNSNQKMKSWFKFISVWMLAWESFKILIVWIFRQFEELSDV